MLERFMDGLCATVGVLATIAGGAVAVLLFVFAVVLTLTIAGAIFDFATKQIAKRLVKAGKVPKSKIGKIILGSHGKGTEYEV